MCSIRNPWLWKCISRRIKDIQVEADILWERLSVEKNRTFSVLQFCKAGRCECVSGGVWKQGTVTCSSESSVALKRERIVVLSSG